MVTCKEIHEQITAFVDDRVDEREYRKRVEEHIEYCPDCRAAYERELLTKMVVRQRASQSVMPDHLRKSIGSSINHLSSDTKASISRKKQQKESWLDRFAPDFLSPVGIGIALVLIALGSITLFNISPNDGGVVLAVNPDPPVTEVTTIPENFFNKAANNFDAILKGRLGLQKESNDRSDLQKYFRENGVAYNVVFGNVQTPLAGAVISHHDNDNVHFAHLVYNSGETLIYVFEVPESILKDGKIVYLTHDVLERLNNGEHIWDEPIAGRPLVMYEQNNIVLAAVSNVPRTKMKELLSLR